MHIENTEQEGAIKEKPELRRWFLSWRCQLPVDQWQHLSQRLCNRLKKQLSSHPQLKTATTILVYQSHCQEPDLKAVWNDPVWAKSRTWGLPRCIKEDPSDKKPTRLSWHRWDPAMALVDGAYGLKEPDSRWDVLMPEQVDLILVPMVAGDRLGYRLGYGGGFYDRLFDQLQWRSIAKVGITFDSLLVDRLPHDQWDCPLDAICTERQWLDISLKVPVL
ncbi:MAG: 5-formyltetrahydrofolate cyclo-ligase [Cyanobacteria bacterium P01_F01_bin.153]